MKLEPFVQVDDTRFTDTLADITARHGAPPKTGRNVVGLNEYDYGHVVFRFQDGGRLEEVTRRAAVVEFGALAVPFAALAGFVRAQDDAAFERAGFLVSPRFGLAFDPSDDAGWVTAIAAHCVATWRALRP